jgi:hypothetical protein
VPLRRREGTWRLPARIPFPDFFLVGAAKVPSRELSQVVCDRRDRVSQFKIAQQLPDRDFETGVFLDRNDPARRFNAFLAPPR